MTNNTIDETQRMNTITEFDLNIATTKTMEMVKNDEIIVKVSREMFDILSTSPLFISHLNNTKICYYWRNTILLEIDDTFVS